MSDPYACERLVAAQASVPQTIRTTQVRPRHPRARSRASMQRRGGLPNRPLFHHATHNCAADWLDEHHEVTRRAASGDPSVAREPPVRSPAAGVVRRDAAT